YRLYDGALYSPAVRIAVRVVIGLLQTLGSSYMKIKPLGDRLVVERIEAEEKTAGGIIIPGTAQEKPKQGKVLAVGPGLKDDNGKRIPIDVEAGDIVLFTQWA